MVRGMYMHPDPKRLAEIGRVVAAGKFVIPIAKRFPLAEVREAQKFAESCGSGKVILIVLRHEVSAARILAC